MGFAIANNDFDDSENSMVTKFIRSSIDRDLLAFHGQGSFGGKIHMTFDLLITKMEVDEKHAEIDLTTIGDNDTDLANGFWGCYGASCLPNRADYDTVQLFCTSFDGKDYKDELKALMQKFNKGWLPLLLTAGISKKLVIIFAATWSASS
ncbi:MAG: hypothetical protein IPJ37_17485 [Bacteroidales bacterium]|nr:hypothetical protein [Bacteroidales bacterium]